MYSRLARISLSALVALVSVCTAAGTAQADAKSAAKCSAAIIKAGGALVQAEAKILQKCRDTALKKPCDDVKKQANIVKAQGKLATTIAKACGGKDKVCSTADADGSQPTLTEVAWNIGTCPNFEAGTCTNAINDCDGISTCIQCIGEASVNQAIELLYPTGRPATTDKALLKCQSAIGKSALAFITAKSKALQKCWGTKVKKTANCPADAQVKIAKAKTKLGTSITKACGALDNTTIGLPAGCLAVTPEGGASCAAPVASVADVVTCVGCVADFKVDCPDRITSTGVGAPYPVECQAGVPTPTPTATPTATPTESVTPTPVVTATPGLCGDNQIQAGEFCDGTATAGRTCGPDFTCTVDCNCACPSKVHFRGDANDPTSILDSGWTGISHRAPIISNGDVTVNVSCSATERPCGVCNVTGLAPNGQADAGQLNNHRCLNDSRIKCTNNGDCGAGTCGFYFGSNLPLAAGGVSACVVNQFATDVTGTANVESGDAATVAHLNSRVFLGLGPDVIDNPCPRCIGDTTINDGVAGGTCDVGLHAGESCDGNGTIPSRPDFATTSLDCSISGNGVALLPIDLTNSTGTVTKTLSASNPKCTGSGLGAFKCICDTCNNSAATPCSTNADCVAAGATICGGKRCLSGGNAGAPCTASSECPSGSCTVPGTGTAPSGCQDNTATAGLDCTDQGDGEGLCDVGPVDGHCTVASGHAQRGCANDAACGGGVGSCIAPNQACFLTGGLAAPQQGTGTLIAAGMADPPVGDVSNPSLGAVFCIGPTTSGSINTTSGLPGPGRVTIKGTAEGLP